MVRRAVRLLAGALAVRLVGALVAPSPAAFDLSGGVSVGGLIIGTRPRLAVSPHAGISWTTDGGFLFALRDVVSILRATDVHGAGVYNHTSFAIGYAWTSGRASLGPSLAIYSAPVCGPLQCARISGISASVAAALDYYLSGWLGVSVSANVDWLTGSDILPPGAAATILVGPLLKWSSK